jgi:hypothetical protein
MTAATGIPELPLVLLLLQSVGMRFELPQFLSVGRLGLL